MRDDAIWRAGATFDELVRVQQIDGQAEALAVERALLTNERNRIIGRAAQRVRYARLKQTVDK